MVLSDLISAEIADLDDHARHVLGAVAAIGREIEPRAACCGRSTLHDERARSRGADRDRRPVAGRRQRSTPTASVTRCSAKSSTPTCSRRNEPRLHRTNRRDAAATVPPTCLRRADRAGELAFHLDRAGDSEGAFVALLAAADAAETVAPVPRSVISSVRSSCGTPSASAPPRSAEVTGCGRPPSSPRTPSATSEQSSSLGPRFEAGPPPLGAAWGHERLGRYLWSSGQLDESRVEFAAGGRAADECDGSDAAPVFAGLGQADADVRRLRVSRTMVRQGLRPRPDRRRQPVGRG